MKTPLTYYGGKQQMVTDILPLIPRHEIYCEPFIGGGAIFFNKGKSKVEIINDFDKRVVNFYEVLQSDYYGLKSLIGQILDHQKLYSHYKGVWGNPDNYSKTELACALYVGGNMSFGGNVYGNWHPGFNVNVHCKKVKNNKILFTEDLVYKMSGVIIENRDAIGVIKDIDGQDTFFYLDPPYLDANQGYYRGYSEQDFNNLLKTLSQIKGKFLLSCRCGDLIQQYISNNNWYYIHQEYKPTVGCTTKGKNLKTQIESLVFNYVP